MPPLNGFHAVVGPTVVESPVAVGRSSLGMLVHVVLPLGVKQLAQRPGRAGLRSGLRRNGDSKEDQHPKTQAHNHLRVEQKSSLSETRKVKSKDSQDKPDSATNQTGTIEKEPT